MAQAARWRLWVPVAFGFGSAGYLSLPVEPSLLGCAALVALALAVTVWLRQGRAGRALMILAGLATLAAFGGLAGKLRTEGVRAPVMIDLKGPVLVEGYIVDVVSPGARGGRLLIAPVHMGGVAPKDLPHRIRVTVAPEAILGPGLAIRLRAGLGPPPPPASPGAYDFARDAWFDRVGGVGFAVTQPTVITLQPPPARLSLLMQLNVLRWSLARRIVGRMGPETGGVAAAMVTGHEAWITPQQNEVMRASGLAHILSISGLHMAIVGGFVFAAVRLLVAAAPLLALRIDGKKVAATLGLAAVWLYLGISGAPSPAIRAAVTATVAFLAILFDRRAISLDALAVAAIIVLMLSPEAATEPGFQMSFAATAALVALAEALPRAVREIQTPWWIRLPQAAGVWFLASLAMSLVAGLATGPFAMHHFNRVASYGLVANLLVAPLSSFVMMPALALGAALEPLGLGGPFLAAAGWSIEIMRAIAERTGQAPGALLTVASGPDWTLPVAFLGILLLCLWQGRLRWIGAPMALVVALWPRPAPPDLWISSDGAAVAVRQGAMAVPARPEARRFALEVWSRRRGLAIDDQAGATLFDCNRRRCLPVGPGQIATWNQSRSPTDDDLADLCRADLIILRSPGRGPCPGRFSLDADDFRAGGAAELYRQGRTWRVVWAQPLRGRRPWTVSDTGG